jgi:uncharacterized protein (DUF2336 family)
MAQAGTMVLAAAPEGTALLLDELDHALRLGPDNGAPARMIGDLTSLFIRHAARLAEEQVVVFDDVIVRLADMVELSIRALLADRLAGFPNAPLRLMRKLAYDEIVVARPVLLRSPRLSEADLVSVALTRGLEHMAAMAGRPKLASIVTDVLVLSGEAEVMRAVAANPGAAFSARGHALLVERASLDAALQATLRQRAAGPGRVSSALARRRPLDRNRFTAAAADIAHLFAEGRLSEAQIRTFAGENRLEEVICSLAALADLPVPLMMRLFALSDEALLLAIARRLDFALDTVTALATLLAGVSQDEAVIGARYDALTTIAAERALRFTQLRAGTNRA